MNFQPRFGGVNSSICLAWKKNPLRNPQTNRAIMENGPVYLGFQKKCSTSGAKALLALSKKIYKSKKSRKSLSHDDGDDDDSVPLAVLLRRGSVVKHTSRSGLTADYRLALMSVARMLHETKQPYSSKLFQIQKTLGQGQYGTVSLVLRVDTGEQLVLKRLLKGGSEQEGGTSWSSVVDEVSVMRHLSRVCGQFMVCYDGFFEDEKHYYITMTFIGNMISLEDWLAKTSPGHWDPLILKNIIDNLIAGLKVIHGAGVAHRDIKPANILVNPVNGQIRYLDFGLACWKEGCNVNTIWGTPVYMAPDIILNDVRGNRLFSLPQLQAADIWGLGIIIFEMISGNNPIELVQDLEEPTPTAEEVLDHFVYGKIPKNIMARTQSVENTLEKLGARITTLHKFLNNKFTIRLQALTNA